MRSALREESVSEVHLSEVTLQDQFFRAGNLTQYQELLLHSIWIGRRPMEFNNLHQFGVIFEMNLDMWQHER